MQHALAGRCDAMEVSTQQAQYGCDRIRTQLQEACALIRLEAHSGYIRYIEAERALDSRLGGNQGWWQFRWPSLQRWFRGRGNSLERVLTGPC